MPRIDAVDVVVLGISPDPQEVLRKWKAKIDLPYDLLSDPDHQILEAWGAWGEKTAFGKTTTGVIRSHWVIDRDGTLLDVQIGVSPQDSVTKAMTVLLESSQ